MTDLVMSFSIPWWIYVGFGMILCGLLWHNKFREEIDQVLATILGLKPREGNHV